MGSALIFNILAVIEIITWTNYNVLTVKLFQNLNDIIFSCLITNDKEIVRMIAGETERSKYFNSLIKNLQKKSIAISFNNNLKLEDLDTDVIILNKKLMIIDEYIKEIFLIIRIIINILIYKK